MPIKLKAPVLLFATLLFPACSYEPEEPGQCKLTCSTAIIGANDLPMAFEWKTAKTSIACQADAAGQAIEGMRASFLLTESIFDQKGAEVARRPVPNISVEPLLVGAMSAIENGETSPLYKGVRTPRSNWCTDACGVVTMDFVPICPPAGQKSEVSVQVHSGALFSVPAIFDVETIIPTN